MLFHKISNDRWFIWTLVFLFVSGMSLISYMQWVNLQMATDNALALALR